MWFFVFMIPTISVLAGEGEKIVGGRAASQGEFPFAICLYGKIRCGGTLVTTTKVLTACHCFTRVPGFNIQWINAIGGTVKLVNDAKGRQEKRLSSYQTHEDCHQQKSTDVYANDIALVIVEEAFVLSDSLKIATLPSYDDKEFRKMWQNIVSSKKSCYTMGWGRIDEAETQLGDILKVLEVKPWTDKECSAMTNAGEDMTHRGEVCASPITAGDRTASGDSGNALFCDGHVFGLVKGDFTLDTKHALTFQLYWPYIKYFGLSNASLYAAPCSIILIFISAQLFT
ncbi:kallikrein-7-like [Cimex lectularius]|uniref:Peptidase S1 domain-containing protein n=1 Tax=Cimex lectularius TaxID=79782 RepID=A0A8I6S2B7_CIMLE|nr:kallikrein-7-like [Cimex lectularius]